MAGNETTRNATAHGMYALMTNPEQFELLRQDPEGRIDDAVEEVLRWGSPVLHFRRTATVDTEIRGRRSRPVTASSSGTSRPTATKRCGTTRSSSTSRATRTRTSRSAAAVRTSASGPTWPAWSCKLILTELVTRMPDMQLAGEPQRLLSNFIGGIKHMPVKWTPGQRVLATADA